MYYRRHCSTLQARTNPYSTCNFLTGVFKHSSLSPFCETKMTPLQRHKRGRQTEGQRHSLGIPQSLLKAANPQPSTILLLEEAGAAEGRSLGFSHSLSPFMFCHQLPADDVVIQITESQLYWNLTHLLWQVSSDTKSNCHSSLLNASQNSQTSKGLHGKLQRITGPQFSA